MKDMVVFDVWYFYLYKLGTLSWWPLKQRNCGKLKHDPIKVNDCDETLTKYMSFLLIEITGKPIAGHT